MGVKNLLISLFLLTSIGAAPIITQNISAVLRDRMNENNPFTVEASLQLSPDQISGFGLFREVDNTPPVSGQEQSIQIVPLIPDRPILLMNCYWVANVESWDCADVENHTVFFESNTYGKNVSLRTTLTAPDSIKSKCELLSHFDYQDINISDTLKVYCRVSITEDFPVILQGYRVKFLGTLEVVDAEKKQILSTLPIQITLHHLGL